MMSSMQTVMLSTSCPETHRFSYIGGVRQINPFGSISEALDELLPTENEQLNTQGRLRALLILNAGIFLNEEQDVREYFSTRNLGKFRNLDKVFFEIAPGNIVLVFDRRVFDCYRNEALPEEEEMNRLFIPLSSIGCRQPKHEHSRWLRKSARRTAA